MTGLFLGCAHEGLAAVCRALAAEFDAVAELSAGCVRMWKGELPDA